MNDAPNDPDVNQMMAVFDKLSRQADTAKDEMAMAVNSFVGRAQDIIIAKRAEIAQLRAQLAERDATIAELRAAMLDLNEWLETYAPEQWFAGYDVAESALMALKDYSESSVYLRAQLAKRDAEIAQLRERVDAWTKLHALQSALPSREDDDAEIMQLRAQVSTLTERLSRCTCTDDYGNEAP